MIRVFLVLLAVNFLNAQEPINLGSLLYKEVIANVETEPVFAGDDYLGPIVSSGYGHRVKKSISMAILDDRNLNGLNDQLYIDVLGRKRKAYIVNEALYDPENLKLRS